MHKMIYNICGNQFKSQKTLTQHNKDVQIEVDLPCSLCDKTFRTKRHLANHKYYTHTERESLQCDVISDDTECSFHTTSERRFQPKTALKDTQRCTTKTSAAEKQQKMMEHLNSVHLR